jgi:glycosyltransferase involved in cell wall biosynthesis
MRILKVTQSYFPFQERGGPAFKVRSIAQVLVRANHDVTVLTADLGFNHSLLSLAGATADKTGWRSHTDGIESVYLTTRYRYRSLTLNPGMIGFCRNQLKQFDVVHIYGLYDLLGPFVAWHCRRLHIPYVLEPLGMTRPIDRGFFLKKVWRRLVGDYLNRASRLIATSALEKGELLAEGLSRDRVLQRYNGIDREQFSRLPKRGGFRARIGIASDVRLVLFLGRLIPRKGADLLIDALPELGEEIKIVIAGPEGEQGYLDELRQRARTRGVAHRVTFCGALYGDDKKAALVDADVFALPSRYENFGNAAAEAIACGTPVIVSDQCGIAPLVQDRCGLLTTYDTHALALGLRALFEQPALYLKLKSGCGEVAQALSWDTLVDQMIEVYQELTTGRSPLPLPEPAAIRAG